MVEVEDRPQIARGLVQIGVGGGDFPRSNHLDGRGLSQGPWSQGALRPGPAQGLASFLAPARIPNPLSPSLSCQGCGEKVRPDAGCVLGQGGWLSSCSGRLIECARLRQGLGLALHCSGGPVESRPEIPVPTSMELIQRQALVGAVLWHKDDPGPNYTPLEFLACSGGNGWVKLTFLVRSAEGVHEALTQTEGWGDQGRGQRMYRINQGGEVGRGIHPKWSKEQR